MKNILNKLVMTAGVIALSATSINAAADNTIVITGDVSASVVVGFADVSAEAANAGRFVSTPDIDLGAVLPGADFTTVTRDIFVNTNSTTGASITLTDASTNAGALMNGANTVPVAYSFTNTGAYTVGTTGAVALNAGVNAGSVAVDTLTINPDVTAGGQAVGTYSTTLTVVIAAN